MGVQLIPLRVVSLAEGTSDESVLNVAQIPVLSNRECNKYFRGRVRENEMCTSSFQGGVGACEVSSDRVADQRRRLLT